MPDNQPDRVEVDDEQAAKYWQEKFGVTIDALKEAVAAAGSDPEAVKEHLLNQGGSAGAS